MEAVETHPWDTQFKAGLRLQAERVVTAATKDEANDLPTLQDAIESMRLVQAIFGLC